MHFNFYKTLKVSALALQLFIVAILVFAPFSPTFQYQKVEAGGGFGQIVRDPWNEIQTTISAGANTVTAWATNQLGLKEYVLDGIAWAFINAVLEEMIRSITAWVNAGFPDGGPAFLQDFGGFLLNIADGIAGDFILGTKLGFLCSPFQLDIRIALSGQYMANRSDGYQPQCRITGILENIRNFTVNVDGSVNLQAAYDSRSFAAGGWAWWLGTTEDQENNVYGAYASAQAALSAELRNAKGEKIKLLEFGRGFLSREVCSPPGSRNCSIVTPGAVIEAQLNKALGGGQDRLTVADEINELIAALLSALARQVITGLGGLFGASFQPFNDSSGNSYASYLDAMANSSAFVGYAYQNYSGGAATSEAQAYLALQGQIISAINAEEAYMNQAQADYPGQISISALPQSLIDARTNAIAERARVTAAVNQINTLSASLTATSTVQQRTTVQNQIATIQATLPNAVQTAQAQTTMTSTLMPIITAFRNSINADITAAGGTPTP